MQARSMSPTTTLNISPLFHPAEAGFRAHLRCLAKGKLQEEEESCKWKLRIVKDVNIHVSVLAILCMSISILTTGSRLNSVYFCISTVYGSECSLFL